MAIIQGACRDLRELLVIANANNEDRLFVEERYLAAAMRAPDALPKLETLHIKGSLTGNLRFLIQALASGAAPSLSRFNHDQPVLHDGN